MTYFTIKTLPIIALMISTHAVLAVPTTITSSANVGGQILPSPAAKVSFSKTAIGGFNAYRTLFFTGTDTASTSIGHNTNFVTKVQSLRQVVFNLPIKSLTYDSTTQSLISNELHGTIVLAGPRGDFVFTTGGELTLSNIRVDLASKAIYATVQGANGVGRRENVALWTYKAVIGDRIPSSGKVKLILSQLQLTQDGFNAWSQGLGFKGNGPASLATINNDPNGWGDMTITVNTTGTPTLPGDPICTTP